MDVLPDVGRFAVDCSASRHDFNIKKMYVIIISKYFLSKLYWRVKRILTNQGDESGRRYFLFNFSQMDSAEAILLDSFGRVASPCFSPKRKTCSSSAVKSSRARLLMMLLGMLSMPVRIECSRRSLRNFCSFLSKSKIRSSNLT